MERLSTIPRPDHAQKLEAIGLSFHNWDNYWCEDACYRFTAEEIDVLEAAANELHACCLEALAHVIAKGRLGELGIPTAYWPAITLSRLENDFSLYGRFDFAYDGNSPPKLLEYNADTPTSLLESAIAQWYWLEECHPDADQFNSLHERLVERWRTLPGNGPVHFASLAGNEEDWVCTTYLMDTLVQSGRNAHRIDIEEIGWDARLGAFVDLDDQPIEQLFKLYPWEWAMRKDFGRHVATARTRFIEPLWKAPLSSKGLLPILWELFPEHPNLLPAFFSPGKLSAFARKPLFSREGANVELYVDGRQFASGDGPYGAEGHIDQALCPLPEFSGRRPVLGVWLVGGEACGLCIREDSSPITTNLSRFVPHYFPPQRDLTMDLPLFLKPVLSFLGYLLSSGAMLGLFVWIYARVTPYREFELIAENNHAAAIALGGAVIGFTLPLVAAIYFTRSIVEMIVWAIITGLVQLIVFIALRRQAPRIEAGHSASAILLATFSIAIGLLNAASISY